ncbi:unnamed protein product [Trichobilharzia regenti]|nr:unnamed protein product [Trichobilharzia regenti]
MRSSEALKRVWIWWEWSNKFQFLGHVLQRHPKCALIRFTVLDAPGPGGKAMCYYLALAYNCSKKYTECSALLMRAKHHAEKAITSLDTSTSTWTKSEEAVAPGPDPDCLAKSLRSLILQAESEDFTCKAASMLDAGEETGTVSVTSLTPTAAGADVSQKVSISKYSTCLNTLRLG